ncbi:MAG: Nramp family divalent metal transporter [Chloroflexi bacterium]|nr:Nramp family divalent metal transporter [Chloroflexota bacterium]
MGEAVSDVDAAGGEDNLREQQSDAKKVQIRSGDVGTVSTAHAVLQGHSTHRGIKRILPFLGPAFIASVAYIDPGNFATNIQGGAQFGYLLIWVIIASNLMAMLIQMLSAKLGIATGRNLAEMCRERFPSRVVWAMWGISEVVAMSTDLAEFLGAALGFHLLFGLPLFPSAIVTGIAIFIILGLESRGFRPLEAVIVTLVGVIALCYLIETILDRPDWGLIAASAIVPRFDGTESVVLAVSILGATVMPHVIFLHSALTQNRIVVSDEKQQRRLFRFEAIDVIIAMSLAGIINAAMLIMAAATFNSAGLANVGTIEEAYRTLEPLLGSAATILFAISLLASGLSSSIVGTMAGQVIMQGYLRRKVPIWLRRLVTMIPALLVIAIGFDPTRTLVFSQVVLSFGIPFALIPLVMFTKRRDLMGVLVNRRVTTIATSLIAAVIVGLNLFLLYSVFAAGGI